MSQQDVVLSVQKIKPGKTEDIREHFEKTEEEREELIPQLQEEGITGESVFVHSRDDGDYLYYYIKADDFDEMLEEFRASDEDWAAEYASFLDETLVGGAEEYHEDRPELVFHIDVPE